ncbi:MAG: hypothetical protein WCY41_03435 [Candidatus Micrarchaeia archaeon]
MGSGVGGGGSSIGTEQRLDDVKQLLKASSNQTNAIIVLAAITLVIGIIQILIMKGLI